MKPFIPREKLSKKARRELDRQRRTLWQYCPATKKIESKKAYTRKTKSHARFDDYGMGFFLSDSLRCEEALQLYGEHRFKIRETFSC